MGILTANQTIAPKHEGIGGWFTINFASVSITYNTTKKTRSTEKNVPISLYFRLHRCLRIIQTQRVCKATISQRPRKIFSFIGCPTSLLLTLALIHPTSKSVARNQFWWWDLNKFPLQNDKTAIKSWFKPLIATCPLITEWQSQADQSPYGVDNGKSWKKGGNSTQLQKC